MESVFDLNSQQDDLHAKIIVALERVSEAFRVLLWQEGKKFGLSPVQIQILIFTHYHRKQMCKVGQLAKEFNMTKATISDSVKTLVNKRLVSKEVDSEDSRSYSISLTEAGRKIALESAGFGNILSKSLSNISSKHKETFHTSLIELISELNRVGVISPQRMCMNCRYYNNSEGHYCNFLKKKLNAETLRIDCPEFSEVL